MPHPVHACWSALFFFFFFLPFRSFFFNFCVNVFTIHSIRLFPICHLKRSKRRFQYLSFGEPRELPVWMYLFRTYVIQTRQGFFRSNSLILSLSLYLSVALYQSRRGTAQLTGCGCTWLVYWFKTLTVAFVWHTWVFDFRGFNNRPPPSPTVKNKRRRRKRMPFPITHQNWIGFNNSMCCSSNK